MTAEKTVVPSAVKMLFADDAFHIMEGGKVCLIGIFSAIFAKSLPVGHPKMAIYQRFTDIVTSKGTGKFEFRYIDGNNELFFKAEGPLQFNTQNRNQAIDFIFHLSNIIFPRPGKVEVKFYFNDQEVNSGTIDICQFVEKSEDKNS